MVTFLQTLKKLLGLKVEDDTAKPDPTQFESVKAEYTELAEDKKPGYVVRKLPEIRTQLQALIASNETLKAPDTVTLTSSSYAEFRKMLDLAEAGIFLSGLLDSVPGHAPGTEGSADATNTEQAFGDLLAVIKTMSVPAEMFLKDLEQYLERFEEDLLYAEARGEYKLAASENKSWITIPLLQSLGSKKIDPNLPRSELAKLFYPCPQLSYFELNTRIPMLPTSLIDVQRDLKGMRIVPLYTAKPDAWYVYIVR